MVELAFPPRVHVRQRSLIRPASGIAPAASEIVLPPEFAFRYGIYESASSQQANAQVAGGHDTLTSMLASIKANNLDSIFWGGHSLWFHELGTQNPQHRFQQVIAASSFPSVAQTIEETGKWSLSDPPDSLTNGWYGDLTHDFDDATAQAKLATILAYWSVDHGTVIDGFGVGDDRTHNGTFGTTTGQTSQKSMPLIRMLQAAGNWYASGTPTSSASTAGIGAIQDMIDAGARKIHLYFYKHGAMRSDGSYANSLSGGQSWVWTPEGDDRSSRFSVSATHTWWDEFRLFVAPIPEDIPFELIMQIHCTGNDRAGNQLAAPTSSTQLRYPTARELRGDVWQALGEGAKSIKWFTWSDHINASEGWYGLSSATMSDRLAVVAEMGSRLRPSIRAKLARTKRDATDPFTISGAADNGAAGPYISTLIDRFDGTRYVIPVSRRLSSGATTISSGSMAGTLRSLEDGQAYTVGSSGPTLPALDGTILEFIPS